MKAEKKLSRIIHLMTKYYFRVKYKITEIHIKSVIREHLLCKLFGKKAKELSHFLGIDIKSIEYKERMEIFNYFYKLGKGDDYIESIWIKTYNDHIKNKPNDLNNKPLIERKDNQNTKTNTYNYGSGYGGRGSIRVPSKKHKNRYKNFLKLFPSYK